MKNLIILLFTIISLVACDKGPNGSTEKIDYLKVQNDTPFEVTVGFFDRRNDNNFIIEYLVAPNQTMFLDSFKSLYFISDLGDGCDVLYINPSVNINTDGICLFGIWNSSSTDMAYDFEGVKLTDLQNSFFVSYADCDTSTNNLSVCNIGTVEEFSEKTSKKLVRITSTTTYTITNQQYLLADSL